MELCFESIASLEEMKEVALKFLTVFPEGGIFLLPSEMGSGKTTFCRCVIQSLGFEFEGSPTFSIAHLYRKNNRSVALHADLFRVKNVQELSEMGFEDMINDTQYLFIEWPEKALGYFNTDYFNISIAILPNGKRKFNCYKNENSQ